MTTKFTYIHIILTLSTLGNHYLTWDLYLFTMYLLCCQVGCSLLLHKCYKINY